MPGTPQKRKRTANHQISPEIGKNCQKNKWNPTHFPPIPTMANGSFLEGNEGNMEEIGARTQSWENLSSREPSCFCFSPGFPQGRNYSGGIGDAWRPWKTKGGSCYNHKTNPEIGKKINQWQSNILLFPLIPTKARTTKLAQKLENTQNQLKPCSASGLLRGNLFKDTILTLLDPIWVCWKLFKFVPQLCKKGNRFRPFARSCLRSLAFG